jgi:hypothetical protein
VKYPDIGELDKFVRVRAWQDEPSAGMGIDQTYDAGVDAWARIEPTGSALFYGTAQVETGITHRAVTWRTSQLNADVIGGSHVIDHGGNGGMRYRVRRATDINGRQSFVLFDLEQLGVIK